MKPGTSIIKLLAKRLALALPLLLGVATIVFILSRLAPGDALADAMQKAPLSVKASLRHHYGLDQSLVAQYWTWISGALVGDFGISIHHHRPVTDVIVTFLPNTLLLTLAALVIELPLGIVMGAIAARFRNSVIDKFIQSSAMLLYSLPAFWIGMVLLTLLSYQTGWLPASHMSSLSANDMSLFGRLVDLLKHLILPAFTVALAGAAGVARHFRAALLAVRNEDWILYGKSLGMKNRTLFIRYELPAAMTPVIVYLGLEMGTLLAGAVVTEALFSWPGVGRLAVTAMFTRDYPLIMGCTVLTAMAVIVGNLLADAAQAALDPRVRYAE